MKQKPRHPGGRPPQRVIPGPGLEGEDFSWGSWDKYLSLEEMAAYQCLRHAALTTQHLGWRPFAEAIGPENHPVDRERLQPIYEFLEDWGFISCPQWGAIIPTLVRVHPIPDNPSSREVVKLDLRLLQRQGPSSHEVSAFIAFFAQEWGRRHDASFAPAPYYRRSARALLRRRSFEYLRRLTLHFFNMMSGPKSLGALHKRIDEIAADYDETKNARL